MPSVPQPPAAASAIESSSQLPKPRIKQTGAPNDSNKGISDFRLGRASTDPPRSPARALATHGPEPGPKCPIQFPKQVGRGDWAGGVPFPGFWDSDSSLPTTLPGVVELGT